MTRQTVHILLVEDDEVDVEAVRRAFKMYKIANPIRVAQDGLEALEVLRSTADPMPTPYMILLDLNMPRMNGIEFLEEIRADEELKKSIVFVLTTSKAEEDKVKAYNFNVAGYIVKSDPANGFLQVVDLFDRYWKVVEFPGFD